MYTQFLDSEAGIVADLTVTRLDEDRFRLVTGAAAVDSDRGWLEHHADGNVEIRDVDELAVIGLGARALATCSTPAGRDDLSGALPSATRGRSRSALRRCWSQRISFVGEPGFEPYVPRSGRCRSGTG